MLLFARIRNEFDLKRRLFQLVNSQLQLPANRSVLEIRSCNQESLVRSQERQLGATSVQQQRRAQLVKTSFRSVVQRRASLSAKTIPSSVDLGTEEETLKSTTLLIQRLEDLRLGVQGTICPIPG